MARSLVFVTDPDAPRRETILKVLRRIATADVCPFETLTETRKAMRERMPHMMIGPWAQGGETLLATRAALAGRADCGTVPQALVLADIVSPSRISLTREAGRADLIPCDPLDERSLFNRLTLLLRGPDALYTALDDRQRAALDHALESMPALRRRLAA